MVLLVIHSLQEQVIICYTYSPFFGFHDEMVIFECEGNNVPVGIFARVIPSRCVLGSVAGGGWYECYFLHYFSLTDVPWPVETVHQLKPTGKKKKQWLDMCTVGHTEPHDTAVFV